MCGPSTYRLIRSWWHQTSRLTSLMPHSTTGRSPAEMLVNRWPCSLLDQSWPDATRVVRCSQEKQKSHHDSHAHSRVLAVDYPVMVRSFVQGQSPPWLQGKVTACTGPLSFDQWVHHSSSCWSLTACSKTSLCGSNWSRLLDDVLLSFPDPIPHGPIEQEDHHRELPQCSQRIRPDDPWTDMLHNYRGKCEEQLIIVLVVLQHSSLFCVL